MFNARSAFYILHDMKRFLARLFGIRPTVQNVDQFGPRMEWAAVEVAFRGRRNDELYRAIGQIVEFQRQQCQDAVQDKSNLIDGQIKFEAGAASSAADVLTMLMEMTEGKCRRPGLREWFGGSREKSGEVG